MIICQSCEAINKGDISVCVNCGKELNFNIPISKETPKPISPPPIPSSYVPFSPTASGAMPMTLLVEKYGIEINIPIKEKGVLLGREDEDNNIFPDIDTTTFGGNQEGVSRRHAQITLQLNQYFIQDMNSTNGTYVNHIKLGRAQKFPLNNNDELVLGRLKFRVRLMDEI